LKQSLISKPLKQSIISKPLKQKNMETDQTTIREIFSIPPVKEVTLLSSIKKSVNLEIQITKSAAKHDYFLTDADLANIPSTEKRNPRFRSAAPMILYKEDDIKSAFCHKHGITADAGPIADAVSGVNVGSVEAKIKSLKAQKEEKSAKMKAGKAKKRQGREDELVAALTDAGLNLRSDSKLCHGYIDGTLTDVWTVPQIVKRMCQVKYLFEYCNIDSFLNDLRKEYREWGEYYNSEDLFDEAETKALRKRRAETGSAYPDIWPWQREAN
jgi:hypothetical protein